MDITTGDVITPREIRFAYPSLFSDVRYPIMAYPLETILAEKYETLCRRGETTTRARDIYDIHTLYQAHRDEIDWDILRQAIVATANNRGSTDKLPLYRSTIERISASSEIRNRIWPSYCKENQYVSPSSFDSALEAAMIIGSKIGFEPERKPSLDDEIQRFNELRNKRRATASKRQSPVKPIDNNFEL